MRPGSGRIALLAKPSAMAVGVFIFSIALHILHIAQAGWGSELLSSYPVSDAFYYMQAAWYRAFMDPGGGYMGSFIPYSPYVRLLTAGFIVLGPGSATPFVVNALLMSGAAVFTALITSRLFGPVGGWLAGCAFVSSALVIFFSGLTVKTNAELFFIAGSSYCFIRFLDVAGLWRLFLSLFLLGLASIDRNNYVVVLLPYAVLAWKHGFPDQGWVAKLQRMLFAGLCALALVGSLSGWQADSVEQPFLSPVGLNFYVGNSPESRGTYTVVPGLRDDIEGHFLKSKGLVEGWLGRPLSREEVSQFWFKRSWDHYRQHPLEYLELQGRKALLLAAAESYGLPEQLAVGKSLRPSMILAPISYALVLALALATLVCTTAWREKPQARMLVYALLGYTLSIWIFFVGERYRLPIFMLLLPFAANTITCLWHMQSWSERLPVLVVALLVLLGSHMAVKVLDTGPGWAEQPREVAAYERRQLAMLKGFYDAQQAAMLHDDAASWAEMASYALRRRFLSDAQAYAENAISRDPDSVSGYHILAEVFHLRQDRFSLEVLAAHVVMLDADDSSGKWKGTRDFTESLLNSSPTEAQRF